MEDGRGLLIEERSGLSVKAINERVSARENVKFINTL
jgi:hypothetical protein